MAERKLRFDAAKSAAISHPHIGMPEPGGSDRLAESGPAVVTASSNSTTLQDTPDGRPAANEPESSVDDHAFEVESAIRQKLISHPSIKFQSLVVRHLDGNICLEGTLETAVELPDVERLVRSVAHVDRVFNHLVMWSSETSND